MTSYDTDLLVVGGGGGFRRHCTHARGLSVIVAEPRENPIDKGVRRGADARGLAESTSLGVDPVGLPFVGLPTLVQTSSGAGAVSHREPGRATHHAACGTGGGKSKTLNGSGRG